LALKIKILNHNAQPTEILATVTEVNDEGHRRLQFSGAQIFSMNSMRSAKCRCRLTSNAMVNCPKTRSVTRQFFAKSSGSVAAPTAGLHFTPELLGKIRERGVKICFVTLHVGAGTFLPVKTENVAETQDARGAF